MEPIQSDSRAFSLTITLGFHLLWKFRRNGETRTYLGSSVRQKWGGLNSTFHEAHWSLLLLDVWNLWEKYLNSWNTFSSFKNERYDYRSISIVNEITCMVVKLEYVKSNVVPMQFHPILSGNENFKEEWKYIIFNLLNLY